MVNPNRPRYECTFVNLSLRGGFLTSWKRDEYREVVQQHADEGWRLVQAFAPALGVCGAARQVDLIFEREIDG